MKTWIFILSILFCFNSYGATLEIVDANTVSQKTLLTKSGVKRKKVELKNKLVDAKLRRGRVQKRFRSKKEKFQNEIDRLTVEISEIKSSIAAYNLALEDMKNYKEVIGE